MHELQVQSVCAGKCCLWTTTHLQTPEGWKAELTYLADTEEDRLPTNSTIDQSKGRRKTDINH